MSMTRSRRGVISNLAQNKQPTQILYGEPQTGNPKNIAGIHLQGSLYSSIFLNPKPYILGLPCLDIPFEPF